MNGAVKSGFDIGGAVTAKRRAHVRCHSPV
jgi:hypothetical protein